MLRSSISLANVIIENYMLELKSELNSIQLKTNGLIASQKAINANVKSTSRKDIDANTEQCRRSINTINKTNSLILQVHQVHQEIISWTKMLQIISEQPISNPDEMEISITSTKIPSPIETKLLQELLSLFERLEEYVFCGIVQKKIVATAA